jgi:hypothetical protein
VKLAYSYIPLTSIDYVLPVEGIRVIAIRVTTIRVIAARVITIKVIAIRVKLKDFKDIL